MQELNYDQEQSTNDQEAQPRQPDLQAASGAEQQSLYCPNLESDACGTGQQWPFVPVLGAGKT